MITNIKLHPTQQDQLRYIDFKELQNIVFTNFPYPIAVSYKNFLDASSGGNKLNALTTFAYDLTSTVFQFLSVVLASEYYQIKAGGTGSLRVYQFIEDMTYRPGPGKWHGFLRGYVDFLKQHRDKESLFPEIIGFIKENSGGKKGRAISLEENHGEVPDKKAGLLDMMIQFRNNLAHSRGYTEKDLDILTDAIQTITGFLFSELSFLEEYKMQVKMPDLANPIALTGVSLPSLAKLDINENLFLEKDRYSLKLFPLLISDRPARSHPTDVFLLESIDNDRVFFSGNRLMSEKLKGRDEMADKVFDFLKIIYEEPPLLDMDNARWEQFRGRCLDYAQQVLSEYILNNKYNDVVYVYPEGYKKVMSDFVFSEKKITFLSNGQGSGKSALCAHLIHKFTKSQPLNEIFILIDARLLDEMGDQQDIFHEFIKKKLGLKGNLLSFLQHAEKDHPNLRFTFIIDNLNEYFRKARNQSFLLEQLMDFTYQFSSLTGLKIIAIARPDYYQKSFERYAQSFKDMIQELTFMPCDTAATALPGLNDLETRAVWENYKQNYTGYSPKTDWEGLNSSVRENCRNPLIMLFLLKQYDNHVIPSDLSVDSIKNKYIKGILKDKELRKTLFDMIKKMHKEGRPYLITDTFNQVEIAKLSDTSIDIKTGLPQNDAYFRLLNMQIIREERAEKEGRTGKKISVNNEMTMDVIISEYDRWSRRTSFLFSLAIIGGLSFVMFIILIYISYLSKTGVEINQIANFSFLNQLELYQSQFDEHFIYKVKNIFNNNYPARFIHSAVLSPIYIIFYGIWTVLTIILIASALFDYFNGKKLEKSFSFFEIMHFKEITKSSATKLIKIALPFLLALFIFGLIFMIRGINAELNSKTLHIFIMVCIAFILFLLTAVGTNNFLNIRKEGLSYDRYLLKSNYRSLFKGVALLTIFISLLSVLLLKSEDWINKSIINSNENYLTLFMHDVNALAESSEPYDIIKFIDVLETNLTISKEENIPSFLVLCTIEGLRNNKVSFLSIDNMFSQWHSENIIVPRMLFSNYWVKVYSVFGVFIVMLFSIIKLPSLLNKRFNQHKVDVKIM